MVTQRLPASGFFFDILLLRPKRFFCRRPHFLSADVALVSYMSSHFILFLFEGRPVSMVVAHPAGSQVCFFRLGRIRKKGGGAQKLVLTP